MTVQYQSQAGAGVSLVTGILPNGEFLKGHGVTPGLIIDLIGTTAGTDIVSIAPGSSIVDVGSTTLGTLTRFGGNLQLQNTRLIQWLGPIAGQFISGIEVDAARDMLFGTTTSGTILNSFVFNENQADIDFRVESDGNANAIFVDAGNNRVGIFTAAPTVPFEVTGAAAFSSTVVVTSTVTGTGGFITTATAGAMFSAQGATTSSRFAVIANTSGETKFGTESNAGGVIFTGSTAYATVFGSAVNQPVQFFSNDALRMTIAAAGAATYHGNFGIGTGVTFGTNAASVLAILNGTAPTTSPADTLQLFSVDASGAGTASLGIRTEEAVAAEVIGASTHVVRVTWNGTMYKILLSNV